MGVIVFEAEDIEHLAVRDCSTSELLMIVQARLGAMGQGFTARIEEPDGGKVWEHVFRASDEATALAFMRARFPTAASVEVVPP